jgi:hypothetical protein
MDQPLTEDDMLAMIAAEVEAAGSQEAWARAHDVSPQLVSFTLGRLRPVGVTMAGALGYRMWRAFTPLPPDHARSRKP